MIEKENKIRVWDIIFTVIVFIVSIFSLMRLTGYERIEDYYDNRTEYLTIQDVRPKYYKDGDWLENKISDFNIICATDTVYKEKDRYIEELEKWEARHTAEKARREARHTAEKARREAYKAERLAYKAEKARKRRIAKINEYSLKYVQTGNYKYLNKAVNLNYDKNTLAAIRIKNLEILDEDNLKLYLKQRR